MNYFQLFGLEPVFNLDLNGLAQTYQTLQKSVHPDRFAHASSHEQMLAVQKSSMINDAYQTLKNPLKRAEYILEIRGTDMPSEQSSFKDTLFLMRQMELRELLEDVKFADDVEDAIFAASQELDTEYEQLFNTLKMQLADDTAQANELACENVRKLKFYQKLHVELDRIEDQLLEE